MNEIHIPILYEDNHILVVEKPPNVPSQLDSSGDPDMLTLLKADLKRRYAKPGNVFLGLVHRLDRPVGGVMVFAKTSKAASRLSEQVRNRSFHKTYLAVVHGALQSDRATLKDYLLKDPSANHVRVVPPSTPGSLEAILHYERLATDNNLSLIRVNLLTGRSHQIRVQFSSIGHPLWGDQRYGFEQNLPGQQLALWSYTIDLCHPTRREMLSYSTPPPINSLPWINFRKTLEEAEMYGITGNRQE